MKIFQSVALLATLVASHVLGEEKQLYHITVPKVVFDNALQKFGGALDVWETRVVDGNVNADVYATKAEIDQFHTKSSILSEASIVQIERDPINTAERIKTEAVVNAACSLSTRRHLADIPLATKYTDNAFFDCWRKADEVFAFLDTLVSENSAIFSKIPSIAKTVEGRDIPAYKLSTGTGKKAIYVQGLIHAREWHAGSTGFYTIASLLDAVRNQVASVKPVVDQYDWYFVPIVNIDGYIYTYANDGDRLWRKNRQKVVTSGRTTFGVDLNRNWGPSQFFNLDRERPSSETYPGAKPLSEPESTGIYKFLKTLPLVGALDIHAYSGLVLYPFGNQNTQVPAPWGNKLKTLGDNVKVAIETGNNNEYTSEPAHELYMAYGTFMDSVFLEFNKTATLSFEMEGDDFIQPTSVIRPGGQHVFNGIAQFARELTKYYS